MSNKLRTQTDVTQIGGEVGVHSYTEEETEAFVDYINSQLSNDSHLSHLLPMSNPENLFSSVGDGILVCKLLNAAMPGTVDERVINLKKPNPWQRNENHTLAINSAKAIGVQTVNIGPVDLNEGRPHIVLGLIWQIIKIGLLKDINLTSHKELVLLLQQDETLEDLLMLPPEELLIRWVNYQMEKAGTKRRISNFSSDIKDSEVYTLLLKQVAPYNECTDEPMKEQDPTERAEKMLQEADKIGCRKFISARDVVKGNPKLNLAFVANLFNNYPALEEINEADYDFAELLDFDTEGTREERSFRFWIQSLGIDVNNLFEDCKDGLLLLKIQDKIEPNIVDWKKVNMKPRMKVHQVMNCNYILEIAKQMKLSIVNIGGTDIQRGDKKLILAIVWQLMRYNLLSILTQIGGGRKISDNEVVAWANGKVRGGEIANFRDSSLKTGVFLCKLCHSVNPKSCDMEFVTAGSSEEESEQNAKYAISVARKIGCSVFLLWEDIVEGNSKMIFTLVASLMKVELDSSSAAQETENQ